MAVPTIPTAADFGKQAVVPGKPVTVAGKKISVKVIASKQDMNLSLGNEQGKKFVDNYLRHNDEDLYVVKQRSEGPFSIIDSVLGRYGLPQELRYLAVIESELKATARSRVGARGPWQLMPATAHELGLKVNRKSDDRVNYYKSTVAAAKYLRDLHREFRDWLLVLAAYNGGPVPVYRAIHKAHSRSFWVLQKYLPAESRGHVKKFIATAYYFEAAEKAEAAALAKPVVRLVSAPVRVAVQADESDDDRFQRLMTESAQSLKASNELMNN
jgi:membrane-bound lytic murein transglycosylase MltF